MKKGWLLVLCLVLLPVNLASADGIPYWTEGTEVLSSIQAYVDSVTDAASPEYLAPRDRIVMFDSDGTLYGERFPTYLDTWLLIHRLAHDDEFEASPEDRAWA